MKKKKKKKEKRKNFVQLFLSNSPLDTYEIIVYNDIGNPPATVPKGKKYNNNNFPECNRTFQTLYPNNDKLFHINFG